jgi:hypothetical protein
MPTGSFIEMFLTTFGWYLYDIVWDVISSTGLAYLPIIAVIIDNVVKPMESQESKSAAAVSLRRLEIDVLRIIAMMVIAVTPYMTLTFASTTYTNYSDSCDVSTKKTAGSSGTTYDDVFSPLLLDGKATKVPVWFYLVMTVSGGVNDAVISSLPCDNLNVREVQSEINSAQIEDPMLRREVQRFVTECYQPARSEFFNDQTKLPSEYPNDDIAWIGSTYFLHQFYPQICARAPVPNFPLDRTRACDKQYLMEDGSQVALADGYPDCSLRWVSPDNGIRARLLKEIDPGKFTWLKSIGSGQTRDDYAIRRLMMNEADNVMSGLELSANTKQWGSASDTASLLPTDSSIMAKADAIVGVAATAVGWIGGVAVDLLIQPVLEMTIKMAPYIQATMLMSIYFLLPWILLVGNYEWGTIKTATVTIFAIKFWTSIWAVISLLDNKLLAALSSNRGGVNGWTDFINAQMGFTRIIIDLIILSLYIGLPMFFLSMLAWGGERSASAASESSKGMSSGAKDAGDAGVSVGKKAVGK